MTERKCPECGERLSFDALRCACGWGVRKGDKAGKLYDHRCTFKAGGDRCEYPVGMFPEGASSGWCIFHRQGAENGAEIVRQSRTVPYLRAIQAIQDRAKASVGVVNTAHGIALQRGNADRATFFADALKDLKQA